MVRPDVDLHIDRLVLDGLPAGATGSRQLQAAVEAELGRLLTERGLPRALAIRGDIERVDAGQVKTGAIARPEAAGAEIARAVYGGLNRGR